MRTITTLQSSLTCKYSFPNILPSLPVPGTVAFTQLCKGLKQFGLSGDKFTVETPTTKLADVRVTASLLRDAISVRIFYEWFEIFVPALIQGQGESILSIAIAVLSALKSLDEEVASGQLVVQSIAHHRIEPGDPDNYLQDWLIASPPFQADAFAVIVQNRGEANRRGRIVVARSAIYAQALFVDYVAEYPPVDLSPQLLSEIQGDYRDRLSGLGLNVSAD